MIHLIAAAGAAILIVATPALIVGRSTELLVRWVERKRNPGENRENR